MTSVQKTAQIELRVINVYKNHKLQMLALLIGNLRVINVYKNHNYRVLVLLVGDFREKLSISLWKGNDAVDVKANKKLFSGMHF